MKKIKNKKGMSPELMFFLLTILAIIVLFTAWIWWTIKNT
jgi:hypothetical protein